MNVVQADHPKCIQPIVVRFHLYKYLALVVSHVDAVGIRSCMRVACCCSWKPIDSDHFESFNSLSSGLSGENTWKNVHLRTAN